MKNKIVWVVVVLVLVGGVFWYKNMSKSVVVSLSAQNNSGISGSATLTDMNGSTLVVINFDGAPVDVAQPMHIHTGSCATIGGVVYPLTSAVNGVSETTLNVPLSAILSQLPLALNVHKSAEEMSTYVACGDLVQ